MGRLTFKKYFEHFKPDEKTTTVCINEHTKIIETNEDPFDLTFKPKRVCNYYLVGEAVDKLAEYEDAEENGSLLRLPLKIGNIAWVIKSYRGTKHIQAGTISEIFFNKNNELVYVVKHIARGKIGEKIFLTREEAEQALQKLQEDKQ